MIVDLRARDSFSAAHCLRGYEGDCRNVHGHNFTVTAVVRVNKLNDIGIGMDFKDLKRELKSFLDYLDHKQLNDLEPFKEINPTSENIAIWLFNALSAKINAETVKVYSITVEESEKYGATYYGV